MNGVFFHNIVLPVYFMSSNWQANLTWIFPITSNVALYLIIRND